MTQIAITISRQLGSGGSYIGQEVARILGIKYVDREILGEAARVLEEDPTILATREERVSTFMEDFFRTLAIGLPDSGYFPPPIPIIYDRHIFAVEAQIIRQIAHVESCVIVGRGGYHILKGHSGLVNVFIHAPRRERIKRVMEIYQIAEKHKAEEMIVESDHCRKRFNDKITGGSWTDALNFNLCIDSCKTGFPVTIDTIVAVARRVAAGGDAPHPS